MFNNYTSCLKKQSVEGIFIWFWRDPCIFCSYFIMKYWLHEKFGQSFPVTPAVIPGLTPTTEITCKRYLCFGHSDAQPLEKPTENWTLSKIALMFLSTSFLNLKHSNAWCNQDSSLNEIELAKQTHFSKLREWTLLCTLVLNHEAEYYTQNWISICGNCKIAICKSCSFVYQNLPAMHPKFIYSCYL